MSVRQGRCGGCGKKDDLPAVRWHILSCPRWAALYSDPELAAALLDPAAEFVRWDSEDRPREHAADLARRVADTQASRRASVGRFRGADILEGL
jgi:hypothetical protein